MENGMFLQLAQGLLSSPGTAIESLAEGDIGRTPSLKWTDSVNSAVLFVRM